MPIEVRPACGDEILAAQGLLAMPDEKSLLFQRRPSMAAFYSHLGDRAHYFIATYGHTITAALGLVERLNAEGRRLVLVSDLVVHPGHRFGLSYARLVSFFCDWFLSQSFYGALALETRRGRLGELGRFTSRRGVDTVAAGKSDSSFVPVPRIRGEAAGEVVPLAQVSEGEWLRFVEAYQNAHLGNPWSVALGGVRSSLLALDPGAKLLRPEGQLLSGAVLADASAIRVFCSPLPVANPRPSLRVLQMGLSFGASHSLLPLAGRVAAAEGYDLICARDIQSPAEAFNYSQQVLWIQPSGRSEPSGLRHQPDALFS